MSFDLEEEEYKMLLLLLFADLGFILVHIIYMSGLIHSSLFSLEKDFGYAEVYQYIKEYWIAILLFLLAVKKGHKVYFAWSLLFVYLLLDDSLQIHETLGLYFSNSFNFQPMFHLRAEDFGQIMVSFLSGSALFTFIGISYLYSNNTAKQASKYLFILVLLVAFFGVLVDMLHIAISWGGPVWGLIEDGGEMIIMSIIVWYVFSQDFSQEKEVT